MAATFCGVLSLSRRAIWINNFTKVEEIIGKAQIIIGEKIMKQNLQDEIQASPVDNTLLIIH